MIFTEIWSDSVDISVKYPVTIECVSKSEVAMETQIKVENEVEVTADVKTEVDVESTDQGISVSRKLLPTCYFSSTFIH